LKHLVPFIFVSLFFSFPYDLFAQVGDIKKNVEKEKREKGKEDSEKDKKAYSEGTEIGGSIIGLFFQAIAGGIGLIIKAQQKTLEGVQEYPERVSLELPLSFGTATRSNTYIFQTGLRGNWGIFASDFRYTNLSDNTGSLNTIEWLVGIIRIPIKKFKIEYGMGFLRLPKQERNYFKQTVGFDWLLESGINISGGYQWTVKTSLGTRFKENAYFRIDYKLINENKFHLGPMLEYSYQSYFSETNLSMISIGIIGRIY